MAGVTTATGRSDVAAPSGVLLAGVLPAPNVAATGPGGNGASVAATSLLTVTSLEPSGAGTEDPSDVTTVRDDAMLGPAAAAGSEGIGWSSESETGGCGSGKPLT